MNNDIGSNIGYRGAAAVNTGMIVLMQQHIVDNYFIESPQQPNKQNVDPELARYLNRGYWEQRRADQKAV